MSSIRQLIDGFQQYVCHTSPAMAEFVVHSANGSYIMDAHGDAYLDFLCGIGVSNLGHAHPRILRRIREQLDKHLHVMVYGEYVIESQYELAKKIASITPGELTQTFFANSGAEAVEGALKLARKATGRQQLISFVGAYHGDTFGALSVGGNSPHKQPFLPLLPGTVQIPFNDFEALGQIDRNTAAVLVEPIQAEGGVILPRPGYLEALRQRCNETGSLLIFDEVQTGIGRTGRWFACQHWQVVPDILVMAKALGGGMPLGCFTGSPELMRQLSSGTPLSHLTTFGGHPVSCAAGLGALEAIEEEHLLERARLLSERIVQTLERWRADFPYLRDVRGKGLLIGLELDTDQRALQVIRSSAVHGLIVGDCLYAPTVVKLSPPLTLSDDEMETGLQKLRSALQDSQVAE